MRLIVKGNYCRTDAVNNCSWSEFRAVTITQIHQLQTTRFDAILVELRTIINKSSITEFYMLLSQNAIEFKPPINRFIASEDVL